MTAYWSAVPFATASFLRLVLVLVHLELSLLSRFYRVRAFVIRAESLEFVSLLFLIARWF